MAENDEKYIWTLSNRQDDRVVLWERDPAHPGGEAFVASSTPAKVAKTGEVERLLRAGLLVEVPEPKDGPKKPLEVEAAGGEGFQDGPGRPTRLGRKVDDALFSEGEAKRIEKQQEDAPKELPVPAGAVVPPEENRDRETARSRR